jgi:hypothetical protein
MHVFLHYSELVGTNFLKPNFELTVPRRSHAAGHVQKYKIALQFFTISKQAMGYVGCIDIWVMRSRD